jgi:8-oxo-dGTP diphosphatase
MSIPTPAPLRPQSAEQIIVCEPDFSSKWEPTRDYRLSIKGITIFRGLEANCRWMKGQIETAFAEAYARAAVEDLQGALERERCLVADGITAIRKAVEGRDWLTEGRGPYAWNDDRWHFEFTAASQEILAALEPLKKVATDWHMCPTDAEAVKKARAALLESPAAAPQHEHRIYTSAVIRRGEKFLCIHHDSLGVWLFPGGKPKNGEPFLDCLIRECREELGITITSASFREAFINTVKGRQWAGLFYDVDEFEGEPHILEPQNHSALAWLSFDEMQQRATNQPEMGIASFCRAAAPAAPLSQCENYPEQRICEACSGERYVQFHRPEDCPRTPR